MKVWSSIPGLLCAFCIAGCGGTGGSAGVTAAVKDKGTEQPVKVEAGGKVYSPETPKEAPAPKPAPAAVDILASRPAAIPASGHSGRGYEVLRRWQAEKWPNAAACKVTHVRTPGSPPRLFVAFQGNATQKTDKAAIGLLTPLLSMVPNGKLSLRVYNPGKDAFELAFAVNTAKGARYYESKPKTVSPGWNSISYDLAAREYKSSKTQWLYTDAIVGHERTPKVMLVIYNGPREGALYFEGINIPRITRPEPKPEEKKARPGQPAGEKPAKPTAAREKKDEKTAPPVKKKRTKNQKEKLLEVLEEMGKNK